MRCFVIEGYHHAVGEGLAPPVFASKPSLMREGLNRVVLGANPYR